MIPQSDERTVDILNVGIVLVKQPSLSYKMYIDELRIMNNIDGLEALKQSVYKELNTELNSTPIYTNYGIETSDLFGQPKSYAYLVLTRRIRECLEKDDRITSVHSFVYDKENSKRDNLAMSFIIETDLGDFEFRKEFNFG